MKEQTLIKPLLAKDVNEAKLTFPCLVMPKIDGSFAMIQQGKLMARSLKAHENKYVTGLYSKELFEGLRGELIAGSDPTAEDLCRNSSSALRRVEGTPETSLWCFDYVTPKTVDMSYKERYTLLQVIVESLRRNGYTWIYCIGAIEVKSLAEYEGARDRFMNWGYEGIVVRNPASKHKEGRSSSTTADLWRWKPWASAEIVCTNLVEQMQNNNAAKTNELGRTERSTHKENLSAKGTLGAIEGTLVNDLTDFAGKVVAKAGTYVTIATGSLTDKQKQDIWDNQGEIIGQLVEFEYMNFGLKDKPRFAQFSSFKRIRSKVDM